ncbi:Uncharacterised protein [Mycobacteroides abscessus subsp. massiliense]|nr:Uncharacterised protein [Mycobacteroides abscessus subsp. massiliense]
MGARPQAIPGQHRNDRRPGQPGTGIGAELGAVDDLGGQLAGLAQHLGSAEPGRLDGLRGRQLRDDHEHVRQPYRGGQQAMGALAVSGRHRDWRRKPRGVLLPWPAA